MHAYCWPIISVMSDTYDYPTLWKRSVKKANHWRVLQRSNLLSIFLTKVQTATFDHNTHLKHYPVCIRAWLIPFNSLFWPCFKCGMFSCSLWPRMWSAFYCSLLRESKRSGVWLTRPTPWRSRWLPVLFLSVAGPLGEYILAVVTLFSFRFRFQVRFQPPIS